MATKYMDPLSIAVGAGARERQAWAENRVMETSVLSGVHVYTVVDAFYKLMQAAFVAIAWSGAR